MERGPDPCAGVSEEQLDLALRWLTRELKEPDSNFEAKLSELATLLQDEQVPECVKKRHEERAQQIMNRQRGGWIEQVGLGSWYQGPDAVGGRYWPALREILSRNGWDDDELGALDLSSTGVVARLGAPHSTGFTRRGLVLGYVQSGKTTNFTAAIAKAADAGYRLFVVLSGMHEGLRQQTQVRLDQQLVDPHPETWFRGTEVERAYGSSGDFIGDANVNVLLGSAGNHRVLCVIKKNGHRLRRFLAWLRTAQGTVLAGCPTLVIDDEADQAGVNAARPDNRPTAINGLMRDILQTLPKVSYIGYTATPYANLLIDPDVGEDLFPRDFILSLPKPPAHFGPESIFGREPLTRDREGDDPDPDRYDMVRTVPEEELGGLSPLGADISDFAPELTHSLVDAIEYFWLATAARRARGIGNRHSTMLVHTSMRILVHQQFKQLLEGHLGSTLEKLEAGDAELWAILGEVWEREGSRVDPAEWGRSVVAFDQIRRRLVEVVRETRVIVDNSMSSDRLDYDSDEPQTVIAIGGNTLSRGLTLEGLCVSFFVRTARAYDTLLQMGRWFGYRRGYEDLPRIWMTDELKEWFRHLATVEQEIRYDIERFELEGLTPLQFGPRLRTHPALAITAAAKMRAAVPASVSYSGRRLQTILFNHRDPVWLAANIAAVRALIEQAGDWAEPEQRPDAPGDWLMRGVDSTVVRNFLGSYRFHPDSRDISSDLMTRYIRSQVENGELERWTVGVLGLPERRDLLGSVDLGLPEPVNLINRSRVRLSGVAHANIKSLMSKEDRAVDLGLRPDELSGMKNGQLEQIRNSPRFGGRGDDSGLLLVYPISKNSVAAAGSESRQDLDAVEDVMGVGIVFPEAHTDEGEQTYMTVDLSGEVVEEPSLEDEPEDVIDGDPTAQTG